MSQEDISESILPRTTPQSAYGVPMGWGSAGHAMQHECGEPAVIPGPEVLGPPVLEPTYSIGSSLGGASSCAGSHSGAVVSSTSAPSCQQPIGSSGSLSGGTVPLGTSVVGGSAAAHRGYYHQPSLPPVIEGNDEMLAWGNSGSPRKTTTTGSSPTRQMGNGIMVTVESSSPQHLTEELLRQLPQSTKELPGSFLRDQQPLSATPSNERALTPPASHTPRTPSNISNSRRQLTSSSSSTGAGAVPSDPQASSHQPTLLQFKPGRLRKSNRRGGAIDSLCFLTPPLESPPLSEDSTREIIPQGPLRGGPLPMQLVVISVRMKP